MLAYFPALRNSGEKFKLMAIMARVVFLTTNHRLQKSQERLQK